LGEGRLTISGSSSLGAGVTIRGGTLALAANHVFGGTVRIAGAQFDLGATRQSLDKVVLESGSLLGGSLVAGLEVWSGTVGSVLSGGGALVKEGAGRVELVSAMRNSGGVVVNGGSLVLGLNDALLPGGVVSVSGGSLILPGVMQSVGKLTLSGGAILGGTLDSGVVDAGSLAPAVFDFSNGRVTSVLSGSGKLRISGGTVIYAPQSDSPNFAGAVEIAKDGTLQLGDETLLQGSFKALLGGTVQNVATRPGVIQNNGLLAFKFGPGVQVEIPNTIKGDGVTEYLALDGAVGYKVKFTGKNLSSGGATFRSGVEFDLTDDKAFGVTVDPITGEEKPNTAPVNLDGGSLKVSAPVSLPASRVLQLGAKGGALNLASELTVAGTIAGAGSLSVDGSGALVLRNGGNTYSGGTAVKGGTLRLENANLGSGSLYLSGAAKLDASITEGFVELGGLISGSGAITKNGSGVLRLTSSNAGYTGAISLRQGVIQLGSKDGSVGGFGNASELRNDAAIQVAGGGNFVIQTPITGSGMLVIGTGAAPGEARPEVTLTAKNDFKGDTEVAGGVLNLAAGAGLTSRSVQIAGEGSALKLDAGATLEVKELKLQSGGTLDVSAFGASAGKAFALGAGQSLGGNGGVIKGSIALGAGSNLAPGNSPGVLNIVAGVYEAQAGSKYTADFDQSSGVYDQIQGDAVISGGLLYANALSRVVTSGSYIVVAGSVTGVYDAVDADFFTQWAPNEIKQLYIAEGAGSTAVLKARAVYAKNSVQLAIERKPYASFGIGRNAVEFGAYLDRLVAEPGAMLGPLLRLDVEHVDAKISAALR
jgi:autotransporter-associated beta strand protein